MTLSRIGVRAGANGVLILTSAGIFRPLWLVVLCLAVTGGCAHRKYTTAPPAPTPQPNPAPIPSVPAAPSAPTAVPGAYVEEGVASWYGIPFDGHRTSNGEIYDMHQFTAAHRTLPFGAIVRVTNMRNGKQIEVRINDRGPFVANRIIDLSLSAAQAIGMVGPGTAPVRLEVMAGPNPYAGFFGVQVGAFQVEENAQRLHDRLAANYSPVTLAIYDSPTGIFYRVRVGHVTSEAAAHRLAGQLHANEQLTTFVVRLDN